MEAEHLVAELPGSAPYGIAGSEARSASWKCRSALRGAALLDTLLSSPTSDFAVTGGASLYSADARTEQAFFGDFLPVSSGLRCAFMRRSPSAPSELSAADQQRVIQQQRLHVHVLQLERKVNMQERLLCQVQKNGDAPTLLQQQVTTAGHLPASPHDKGNVSTYEVMHSVSVDKREDDDVDKISLQASRAAELFSQKRCLSPAELPSLVTLPPRPRAVSIPAVGTGCHKVRLNLDPQENSNNRNKAIIRMDAADDGTPSTATVFEHSPAGDKKAVASFTGGSGRQTARGADSMEVMGIEESTGSVAASSKKDDSILLDGVHGERSAGGPTILERHATERASLEKQDHATGALQCPIPFTTTELQANESDVVAGEAPLQHSEEVHSVQSGEQGPSAAHPQKDGENGGVDLADAASVVEEKKTKKVVAGNIATNAEEKAKQEEHEGESLADVGAESKKAESMRSTEQFFRIKLCAKHMRRPCRKGPVSSYAHAQGELRELPNLWKTKLCATHKTGKPCPLETACPFAHGEEELRSTADYYKTKLCKFWMREARCEAGGQCRHAHGVAELRQQTHQYGDLKRGGPRVTRRPESLQAPPVRRESSPKAMPGVGKPAGRELQIAGKAKEQKGPSVKDERPRRRSGQVNHRTTQNRPGQNPAEAGSSHRRSDAPPGHSVGKQQCSFPKTQHKAKEQEGGSSSGNSGKIVEAGTAKGRMKRKGRKNGGFCARDNVRAGSIGSERRSSASGTVARPSRPGEGSIFLKNFRGQGPQRRPGRGPSLHRRDGVATGRERRGTFVQMLSAQRHSTRGSLEAQRATGCYYKDWDKAGMSRYLLEAPPQYQAERDALQAQHAHIQSQQRTQLHPQPGVPMHGADTSALNVANANASTLYGLTPGLNPYGALAACQQQTPYGLSLLSGGPPSCSNLQTAAAAAAAVVAIAQQQQQQLEAAAKAAGAPVYQNVPFLGPHPLANFPPSHLSYAAPARGLPSPFATGPVGGTGGAAAAGTCGAGVYSGSSYPVYPYAAPGASSLLADAHGGPAAPCVSPSYSPRGISTSYSVRSYDGGGPDVCVPLHQGENVPTDSRCADTPAGESAPIIYISHGRSQDAAACHALHAVGVPTGRNTPLYPFQRMQEDSALCSCRDDGGTRTDKLASA